MLPIILLSSAPVASPLLPCLAPKLQIQLLLATSLTPTLVSDLMHSSFWRTSPPIPCLAPHLLLLGAPAIWPTLLPCHHSYSLSSYSLHMCEGSPSKMQIGPITLWLKLEALLTSRIKSHFKWQQRKSVKVPRLPISPPPCSFLPARCFYLVKEAPKKTPSSAQLCTYYFQSQDALLFLLAWKLHFLPPTSEAAWLWHYNLCEAFSNNQSHMKQCIALFL